MRNSNLLTHLIHDSNTPYHLLVGLTVAGLCYWLAPFTWWLPATATAIVGVIIEIEQRAMGGNNTLRESVMDILTTALPGALVSLYAWGSV